MSLVPILYKKQDSGLPRALCDFPQRFRRFLRPGIAAVPPATTQTSPPFVRFPAAFQVFFKAIGHNLGRRSRDGLFWALTRPGAALGAAALRVLEGSAGSASQCGVWNRAALENEVSGLVPTGSSEELW